MRYSLYIDRDTNAVLGATYEQFAWKDSPIVDCLPDGCIYDYDFINGEYVLNAERKAAREQAEEEAANAKTTEEVYAEALNLLGVQTEEVTDDAE